MANDLDLDDVAATSELAQHQLAAMHEQIERLTYIAFRHGAMYEPPCFLCGYSGAGYFQPDKHPCAAQHHEILSRPNDDE